MSNLDDLFWSTNIQRWQPRHVVRRAARRRLIRRALLIVGSHAFVAFLAWEIGRGWA